MSSSAAGGRYSRPIHSLVLDTAPLLTSPYGQIKSFNAINYYTVPLAKEEVKDETARAALEIWGSELRVRQPLAKSIQEVTAFAKKTGDYGVLSLADIHILALTYELETELNHGDWRLFKEPGSKEKRGPQPAPKSPSFSAVSSTMNNAEDDDDDMRSVITSITNATITPSESASTVFRNPFNPLKPPSSSGSEGTRSDGVSHKISTFDDSSAIAGSQVSTPSTANATVETPSIITSNLTTEESITTQPLASPRHTASGSWNSIYDNDDNSGSTARDLPQDDVAMSDSEDGEGSWITPANIKKHKIRDTTTSNSIASASPGVEAPLTRRRSEGAEKIGPIMKSACMTGDYAMQNVALQMGLNLVSMDGGGVRQVKTWVLRCHGCFTITKKMDLKFCPACGGDTLLRTSTSTSANGEVRIHLKKNMQWTNRGTKFALPKPRGMTATPSLSSPPPVLRGDQKEYVHTKVAQKNREKDLMDPDNIPAFLDGGGKNGGFGFGGRSSGRIGGGRGRGTNAVRRR